MGKDSLIFGLFFLGISILSLLILSGIIDAIMFASLFLFGAMIVSFVIGFFLLKNYFKSWNKQSKNDSDQK